MLSMEAFYSSKGEPRCCIKLNRTAAVRRERGQVAKPRGKVIQVESRWKENVCGWDCTWVMPVNVLLFHLLSAALSLVSGTPCSGVPTNYTVIIGETMNY